MATDKSSREYGTLRINKGRHIYDLAKAKQDTRKVISDSEMAKNYGIPASQVIIEKGDKRYEEIITNDFLKETYDLDMSQHFHSNTNGEECIVPNSSGIMFGHISLIRNRGPPTSVADEVINYWPDFSGKKDPNVFSKFRKLKKDLEAKLE